MPKTKTSAVRGPALLSSLLLGLSACSSSPAAVASDARDAKGRSDTGGDTSLLRESGPSADARADSLSGDSKKPPIDSMVAIADSGDPIDPKPPAGATQCGSGTFSAAEASTSCTTGAAGFTTYFTEACSAASSNGGEWQAWCTTSATYFWARFKDVTVTSAGCSLWYAGGGYLSGTGGGSAIAYASPYSEITDSSATDVAVSVTVGPKPVTATLFMAPSPDTFFCKTTAPGFYLMLAADAATQ